MSKPTSVILPNLRPMVNWNKGQNFQVNGYLQFQMECLGESRDYDYWFFAGVGGDAHTQVFTADTSKLCHSLSQIDFSLEFAKTLYDAVGYDFAYVTEEQFNADRPRYLGELVKCIDRGIPVIAKEGASSTRTKAQEFSLLVGYEDGGGRLLFVEGDSIKPYKVPTDQHVSYLFVIPGARKQAPPLADVYRRAVLNIPALLTRPHQGDLYFGREAFTAWADHLLAEDFAGWTDEQLDLWKLHTTYVCIVATNGSDHHFLDRAVKLCPDLPFLPEVVKQYAEMGRLWEDEMDATGGSFNITRQTLRNKEARRPIAAFIRRYAACCDRILEVYRANGWQGTEAMQPKLSKAHRVKVEGDGASVDFDYPFSGFRDLDFTNCFASLYMYLEDFTAEASVLKQQQERLFFLFDTVSGRSATVRRWGNVPTPIYREIYDTDDMVSFLMGYAGYAYAKHTDNLAEQIRKSIDRGIPVLARRKRDGTPYLDGNDYLAIAGGDSFRLIVGYKGDQLRMAEPKGAQRPPKEAPKLDEIASIYVITGKAPRQFTLLDGLRRIKRVMDADREAGEWDQYIRAFENYWERLKDLPIEQIKQRFEYACKGTTWNCHNFTSTFRTHEYTAPAPEHSNNWIWDELRDPRLGTIPTRTGRADDDPLRLPPKTLIDWACDDSHTRQWQLHALYETRDWSKKYYHQMEWGTCETAAMILRKIKEDDGFVYQGVCAMIEILEGERPRVRTANGGSYIDGVPRVRWGDWKDSSYCGCVTALLNAAGIPVSYEEVMGLSGVCYQAIMRDDWDPSSQMPQNGTLCEKNVGDAFGISVYTPKEDREMREQAKKSIDSGHPVLLVGGRWAPEWTIACGYEVGNGKDRFFGRTYFDDHRENSATVPKNEIHTENRYFCLSGFPGVYPAALTRFYDRQCQPISRKQALKVSLEMCIKMFEQKPGEHHRYGYDAYDVLISGLELNDTQYASECGPADDARYQSRRGSAPHHIGSMLDARRAAYRYLDASARLLGGDNRAKLAETAKIYKTMLDNLLAAVPYEKTTAVFNSGSDPMWDAAQRQRLVAALKENKELERQARVLVVDILAHWDE